MARARNGTPVTHFELDALGEVFDEKLKGVYREIGVVKTDVKGVFNTMQAVLEEVRNPKACPFPGCPAPQMLERAAEQEKVAAAVREVRVAPLRWLWGKFDAFLTAGIKYAWAPVLILVGWHWG
ncbi:MAG: hypothetical protein ACM33U_09055 [Solirubrobacterales bacterium]|nr:hypothetical protein [Solirubrobacterales bacterium]